MRPKKLLWRIYLAFFVSAILAIVAVSAYLAASFSQFYRNQVGNNLLSQARIIAREIEDCPGADIKNIDPLCKDLGGVTRARITVVAPDGRVLGDSQENPALMENHKTRPEIAPALSGADGTSVRFSSTLRQSMMYVAVPVRRNGEITAVARTALSVSVMDWVLHTVYRHIIPGVIIIAVVFAILALLILRRITRPLENMRMVAERLAQGDLNARVSEAGAEETEALARALNQMADQLGERMRTITEQRGEQEAMFASMLEGVLAVDREERILRLNQAAAQLLEIKPEQARGRAIQEIIRNPDLQNFIGDTLAHSGVLEGEIVFYGKEERFLQLHGTVLKDIAGRNIGALVVFTDITRLKRLETIRRDFVANVSHELKTPITALKGCVETLAGSRVMNIASEIHCSAGQIYGGGTTSSRSERPEVRPPPPENDAPPDKFIAMMVRQVERLEAIVNDLLSLSRIEFDAEHGKIQLEDFPLADVLGRAAQNFTEQAARKKVVLTLDCPDDLKAKINAALLEQAVGNLIDNAIKYSGEGARVRVSAGLAGGSVEISVADQGPGIEKKHLERIFERFYRVDQARSRALGGTGLGLSIVKHIALAHRGTVGVTSAPGQGSTFIIRLPVSEHAHSIIP